MPIDRLPYLLDQYLKDSISIAEKQELSLLVLSIPEDQLSEAVEQAWLRYQPDQQMDHEQAAGIFKKIIPQQEKEHTPVRRIGWKRWAAAASIIVLLGVSLLLWNNNKTTNTPPPIVDVLAPDRTKAMITLADGRIISVDSLTSLSQGDVDLVKLADGRIVYSGTNANVVYNTLSNPRGSKLVNLTLSDGTKVWLNSESSLHYPIAFPGQERKVITEGEVYFEVAKDPAKKFLVQTRGITTEVVGTHFNVNNYEDEDGIRVTLLEGSVKVYTNIVPGAKSLTLKPGQQAHADATIKIIDNVDLDATMAWKNNLFHFESTDLKTILREFARWYDINVVYEGPVNTEKYLVIMNRNTPLASVLKSLQANDVQFRIEGKTLYVR